MGGGLFLFLLLLRVEGRFRLGTCGGCRSRGLCGLGGDRLGRRDEWGRGMKLSEVHQSGGGMIGEK